MACRISELVIDAAGPERLAAFWSEVLGYVELDREDDGIQIGLPGAGSGGPQPTLVLGPGRGPGAEAPASCREPPSPCTACCGGRVPDCRPRPPLLRP
jgi:hypothetical protein